MPAFATMAETHSAVVFFVGDRAYKLKKPVDLGFLDFRSREAREEICHREVELNRRLAPDVYLGVADVVGPDSRPCDHLVVMRRMPADRRLTALVERGLPVEDHLWRLAHLLAAFHARSPRTDAFDTAAGAEAMRHRWDANTAALIEMTPRRFDDVSVGVVHGLACRYLDGRGPLLAERIADGRAVDGHGDLLADDIFCLDDRPRVLDCIEFDDALRLGDGLADAAFLTMDLERLGHPELGDLFLRAYREHRGDAWPSSLAHHYVAYRAQVRAKVTAIRADQGDPDAGRAAVALLEQAGRHLEAGRVRLVLVGGLPGTGKSTLGAALAAELDATLLRSDEIRKELAGMPASARVTESFGRGLYGDEFTARVYETMLDRAETLTAMGESVVLDASWTAGEWRQRARAAATATSTDVIELRCDAPFPIAQQRLLRRAMVGADASDATPAVAEAMAATAARWPEAITIDTDRPEPATVADAMSHLRAPGLVARPTKE